MTDEKITRTAPPTKEGWYYGRLLPDDSVEPWWVYQTQFGMTAGLIPPFRSTADMEWFGPVPIPEVWP